MPKVTLSQTITYGGKFYGPGVVDVDDADAAKALTEREAAIQGAKPRPMDQGSVDEFGGVHPPAPVATQPAAPSVPRRVEKPKG